MNNKIKSAKIDSAILITDSVGNIIGGDTSDWDFNSKNYQIFLKDEFPRTNELDGPIIPETKSFFSEVKKKSVILTWYTAREIDCEGFDVERTQEIGTDAHWKKVAFVKGSGNSKKTIWYKYTDKNLPNGNYLYRLKQISTDGETEYFNLSEDVAITSHEKIFDFYPVYPNPVSDKFTIRVYSSEDDTLSLYFIKGNDTTYAVDHEPQEKGFYKLTLNKETLGFENETVRLYIDCESCDKKKNFGDIQFN
ncbi:MAG: hypothetical protein ABI462_03085 [Ignavibacteria bacterium]